METANIIDGMVSNENGEEVSAENEEAIRDLLQEYDQSVLEPPTHPPASTQSVSNPTLPRTSAKEPCKNDSFSVRPLIASDEDDVPLIRHGICRLQDGMDQQASEFNLLRQACARQEKILARQEEVLAQLVEQQRTTNETLSQLSSTVFTMSSNKVSKDVPEKKLPAQASPATNSNRSCSEDVPEKQSPMPSNIQAPKAAVAKTQDGPEKTFPMPPNIQAPKTANSKTQDAPEGKLAMPSSIQAPKAADAKTPSEDQPILNILPGVNNGPDTDRPIDSDETSAALLSKPSNKGKLGWAKLRGSVDAGKSAPQAEDATSGKATDDAEGPKTAMKGALAASLKAVSAFSTATKLPDSKVVQAQKQKKPSIGKGALERKNSMELMAEPKARILLRAVVRDSRFSYFFGLLIVANSICIGLQADFVAHNPGVKVPGYYQILESIFCVIFLVELTMKIIAEGKEFFLEQAWRWNVFDLAVVLLAVADELVKITPAEKNSLNLTFIRFLRILRIGRIMRLIRVLKVFRELRVLINSILGSLKSLGWTILLLIVIMYVVAIYVTQVVSEHRSVHTNLEVDDRHAEDLENMKLMFGSVAGTLYSLYKAMSGGADWGDIAQPLEDRIHVLFAPLFSAYIAFAVFAVLNVVTGVFVNEAMKMAASDQEFVIEEELARKGSDVNEFIRMFIEADADGSGTVSWAEFTEHMEDDRVKAYFKVLDLNVDEAQQLFDLLDSDNTGEVSIDAFVKGCVKLKGSAKSIDMQTLLIQTKSMSEDLRKLSRRVDSISKDLKVKDA